MSKNELIEDNLNLVVSLAKRYIGKGVDIDDLIQEGCIALINASKKFDKTKNCKFTTYAFSWIENAIKKTICSQPYMIKKPKHMQETMIKFLNVKNELSIKFNREATIEEIAEKMKCKILVVMNLMKYYNENFILSLQTPVIEGNLNDDEIVEESFEAYIPYLGPTPEQIVIESLEKEYIKSIINKLFVISDLTEREIGILKLRYESDNKKLSLEKIGKIYGISRERVRQIEVIALNKIRQTIYDKSISSYEDILNFNDNIVNDTKEKQK